MIQHALQIREQTAADIPVAVEILNSASPPDAQTTTEHLESRIRLLQRSDVQPLHLLALLDEQPAGVGAAGRAPHHASGRVGLQLAVYPEFRRQGIGRVLFERLLAHARQQSASEVMVNVDERDLPRVERWLEQEAFHESERMRKSELPLADLNLDAMVALEQRSLSSGLTLTTLADEDTEENRRRLWELNNQAVRDIPFDVPHEDTSWEDFQEMLNEPHLRRDCLVIARDGDRYVGFTALWEQSADLAGTGMTGVHPEYRNRGIALAVKARCARLAQEAGFLSMQTHNHVNNGPMLAVNKRLGYVAMPERILFVKSLNQLST